MMFDLDKCMNQDGGRCLAGDRPARVVCTDYKLPCAPIIVLIAFDDEQECIGIYMIDGRSAGTGEDLRNLPEYKEVEVTLWRGNNGGFYASTPGQEIGVEASVYGRKRVNFPRD